MWILKNSKELLDHLKSPNFNLITNIKSFDFSTLYTTIPHQKLKSRLATIIRNSFLHKNGNRRYKYLVLGREGPYFVKEHSDAKNKYTEEDIIKMLEFLVDNIFVVFAGKVFQQIVGIPMGTNCAPLLADIFLYSYEAEFIQSLLSAGKKRLASQFNFTYRYIDDVLSINNPDFENYLGQMYPPELEIKDTTESNTSASYLDLLLSIGRDGQLRTSLYDKRDDFNFHITNFPFLSSNIPSSPAYGVFISQLIRYARACSSYECFILRAMRLSNKLLGQGYVKERLKSSLRKFYGRYGDLTKQYEVPLSRMLHDILDDDHIQWHPPLIGHYTNFWPLLIWTLLPNLTFYLIVQGFHRTYATGAACQQRTLTPPDTWSCPTLGLACVLMSRPISPELVLSPDFWISNTPRYFSFALNRDANCFFSTENKDCMKSASYEYRKTSARRGAQLVHIGMSTVCLKTFPVKTTKILSTRNSSILMMSSSEYFLLVSECSCTKYVSSCPNTKDLYIWFRIIPVSLFFNFWWGMVV